MGRSTRLLNLTVDALGVSREGVDNELAARVRNHERSARNDALDHHPIEETVEPISLQTTLLEE